MINCVSIVVVTRAVFLTRQIRIAVTIFRARARGMIRFFIASAGVRINALNGDVFFRRLVVPVCVEVGVKVRSNAYSFCLFPAVKDDDQDKTDNSFVVDFRVNCAVDRFEGFN